MPATQNTKFVRSLLLFVFFLSFHFGARSQEDGFSVSGTIWDSENGEPIENVNISLKNTKRGSTSNLIGQFSLDVNLLPFYLELSHIGYETKTVGFEGIPLQELNIYLHPKSESLSEVTITSQSVETLYADRFYSVLDYELLEEGIVLLIYKTKLSRAELLLQDYDGKHLLKKTILPMKPLALYKDCLGNVHILSRDKSYQVVIEEDKISLLPPYGLAYFTEVMAGCKFQIGNKVYFEEYEFYDLIKKIYYVSTEDTTSHLLAEIRDDDKLAFLNQNPENYALDVRGKELNLLSQVRGTAADLDILGSIRNMNEVLRFNEMAYLSTIYAPFYALKDSLAIFNHPKNMIEFYDTTDALIGTTEIDYHRTGEATKNSTLVYAFVKSSKWLEEIYVDEIRNRAYTLFQKINGTREVKEINLQTGEVSYRLNIPFSYVQKIKIRDDKVYFVYKGYGESQKKKLYRQKIR